MFQHEITLNWLQQKPTEQKKMRRHTVQRVKIYKICISPSSEIAIRLSFKSSDSNFFYHTLILCLPMCIRVQHACAICLNMPEEGFLSSGFVVMDGVSHCVGTGNQTQLLCKKTSALNCWVIAEEQLLRCNYVLL